MAAEARVGWKTSSAEVVEAEALARKSALDPEEATLSVVVEKAEAILSTEVEAAAEVVVLEVVAVAVLLAIQASVSVIRCCSCDRRETRDVFRYWRIWHRRIRSRLWLWRNDGRLHWWRWRRRWCW